MENPSIISNMHMPEFVHIIEKTKSETYNQKLILELNDKDRQVNVFWITIL